jgi:hypothetical protein
MENLKFKLSSDEATSALEVISEIREGSPMLEIACPNKIKPRALIFKANDKDLHQIKVLIETQFPKVEIIYVTSGPPASILRVTKSMPFETQNPSTQPIYTVG